MAAQTRESMAMEAVNGCDGRAVRIHIVSDFC